MSELRTKLVGYYYEARRHASASKALMAYALHAEIRLDDPGAALAAQLEIDARLSV